MDPGRLQLRKSCVPILSMWKVRCSFQQMVPISELRPHPRNRNRHPPDQIQRLAKIIEHQGWRRPVRVSKLSGWVTAGHGAIEAAKLGGQKKVPVDFQEYENEDQEYADCVADNSISSWADLDLSGINADLADLGPDLDLELLGLQKFTLDAMAPPARKKVEFLAKEKDGTEDSQAEGACECPRCGARFIPGSPDQ